MLLARLSSENCLQALLWASFRRGFLLGRRPCKPTCCSVWRMVWALTSWPATSATSKAMLAALMLLLFEASFCTWHTAQGQVWTAQMGFQGLRVRRESLVLQDPMDHQGRGGCQGWKAHEAWREHEGVRGFKGLKDEPAVQKRSAFSVGLFPSRSFPPPEDGSTFSGFLLYADATKDWRPGITLTSGWTILDQYFIL